MIRQKAESQLIENAASGQASSVRWQILAVMLLLSMVTYLDRVNISIAARHITDEYHLTDVQMGKIFSAFILAYGLFQVPGGWLADRFGPRRVLTLAIIWWSLSTVLTASIVSLLGANGAWIVFWLALSRFALGIGEAAAWPSFNRTISSWMAVKERGFASSVPLAGGGLGAAITPPLIAWLMLTYGWRATFWISGLLGVGAALVWYVLVRDRPELHPRVNAAEIAIIHSGREPEVRVAKTTPWLRILSQANVWLLFLSAMTCGYMVYIYMTWFFTYLVEERHLSQMTGSWYNTGPYIAMAVLTPIGGVASDRIARKFSLRLGRRAIAMGGMLIAGFALIAGARVENIVVSIVFLSLGAGAIYFALAGHWATSIDISPEHAGTVSGFMNFGGNVGGLVSPVLTPLFARQFGWTPALEIAAVIIIAGATLWWLIDPDRKV